MTEMFILYEGEGKAIEFFTTHPDVEESDDEKLGWHLWQELGGGGGGFGNGNNGGDNDNDNVQMDYLEEGGPSVKAVEDKGRGKTVIVGEDVEGGDTDRDSESDSDDACSGLRDSSSSDGDGEEIYDFEEGIPSVKAVKDIGKPVIVGEDVEESVVVIVVMTLGVLSAHQMVRR
ncbi:hypothetical protein RHMOL_Rhmol06G0123800 [Rhododendron molle]|uniref:Uncharacterized protein n=1 Tax=Rhododendron molle TaxID=49168 RepID=A0ACC0NCC5_RHOML|nr:hypothetical protein RHMOL_Rhmol06G0123800 [Rhododendron molle]